MDKNIIVAKKESKSKILTSTLRLFLDKSYWRNLVSSQCREFLQKTNFFILRLNLSRDYFVSIDTRRLALVPRTQNTLNFFRCIIPARLIKT